MLKESKIEKPLDGVAIAAGGTVAAATGLGAAAASGARQFGDAVIQQAREHAEATLQKVAAEDLEHALERHRAHLPTKEELIEIFVLEGRDHKRAERMAVHELAKELEKLPGEAAKSAARLTAITEQDLRAGLNHLESQAARWKTASILEKPLLGFQAASTSVKLGVIGAAAALGVGAGWAVHSLRSHDAAKPFAERIKQERAAANTLAGRGM